MDILKELGVEGLEVDLDETEVGAQTLKLENRISFDSAFRRALGSFIFDGSDDESPISVVSGVFPGEDAQEKLLEFMNQGKVMLLKVGESPDGGTGDKTVEDYWIFQLSLPGLSDHAYWAMVHRKDVKPTTNCGFN